jgi:hypothetical protein
MDYNFFFRKPLVPTGLAHRLILERNWPVEMLQNVRNNLLKRARLFIQSGGGTLSFFSRLNVSDLVRTVSS